MTEPTRKLSITYFAMFMAMLFWGLSFIWTKELHDFYRSVNIVLLRSVTIVTLRLIISSVFLLLIGMLLKKLQPLKKKDIAIMALLAFFEPFLYFIGETTGLEYVSATVSSVLIATIPLLSPIAAWYFFKEKLGFLNFVGVFVSICGVCLVILKADFTFSISAKGVLLMVLAVFSAIGYSVVVMNVAKKYNVFSIIVYQNLFGIVFFLPFFLFFDIEPVLDVKITFDILKPLLSLAILASSIAFMLFTYGIRELGIVKANAISNIIPVFTATFSFFLLNEKLSYLNILGILIVLLGLFLSQLRKRMHLRNKLIPFKKQNGSIK